MAKQTKADRKEAQTRLAEQRAQEAAAQKRRTVVIVVVTVAIIAVILGSVGFAISSQNKTTSSATGPTPAAATGSDGGLATGVSEADAAAKKLPTIEVYEDYQCPVCKTFETINGQTLTTLAETDEARVVYNFINIIGPNFSGVAETSSLRAAGAAACSSDEGKFLPFNEVAFANQPTEGTGMTDETLISWGKQAGITSSSFSSCVNDQKYVGYAKRVNAQSSDRGVTGTPTIFVDGKELKPADWQTNDAFKAAIVANTKK